MVDAVLTAEELAAMLRSVATAADFLDVTIQDRGRRVRASLSETLDALTAGRAIAVQMSYRIADTSWSASVTPDGGRFRMLRVERFASGALLGGE